MFKVRLEFSTNHGMSWLPVYKPCLPSNGSCNAVFTKGTVYDATEFSKWKRVTVSLLPATWYDFQKDICLLFLI